MIYFDNLLEDDSKFCEIYNDYAEAVINYILSRYGIKNCEVSVSFVDSGEIKRLNKKFRGIDSVTDVLSFPLLTTADIDLMVNSSSNLSPNSPEHCSLGDIIICLEKAEEQANHYGHGIKREIAFLTAHSMLHLIGYDHETDEDEREMFALQEKILKEAGFERN